MKWELRWGWDCWCLPYNRKIQRVRWSELELARGLRAHQAQGAVFFVHSDPPLSPPFCVVDMSPLQEASLSLTRKSSVINLLTSCGFGHISMKALLAFMLLFVYMYACEGLEIEDNFPLHLFFQHLVKLLWLMEVECDDCGWAGGMGKLV